MKTPLSLTVLTLTLALTACKEDKTAQESSVAGQPLQVKASYKSETAVSYADQTVYYAFDFVPPFSKPVTAKIKEGSGTLEMRGDGGTLTKSAVGPTVVEFTDAAGRVGTLRFNTIGPLSATMSTSDGKLAKCETASIVITGGVPPYKVTDFRAKKETLTDLSLRGGDRHIAFDIEDARGPKIFWAPSDVSRFRDLCFGEKGKLSLATVAGEPFRAEGIVAFKDGLIVVGRTGPESSGGTATLLKLDRDGRLDDHFGVGGLFTLDARDWNGTDLRIKAVQEARDGGILITGTLSLPRSSQTPFVAKLYASGKLVSTYGDRGLLVLTDSRLNFVDVLKTFEGEGGNLVLFYKDYGGTHLLAVGPDGRTNTRNGTRGEYVSRETGWIKLVDVRESSGFLVLEEFADGSMRMSALDASLNPKTYYGHKGPLDLSKFVDEATGQALFNEKPRMFVASFRSEISLAAYTKSGYTLWHLDSISRNTGRREEHPRVSDGILRVSLPGPLVEETDLGWSYFANDSTPIAEQNERVLETLAPYLSLGGRVLVLTRDHLYAYTRTTGKEPKR